MTDDMSETSSVDLTEEDYDVASACFCSSRRCASPTDLRGRSLGILFTKFLFLFPLQFFTIY
ncbi:hypothetical protein CCUS01_10704 [Colletotrichum cuscutae]|uniref:Uncharacterized protein n=1 Tax=Colletotrichum cuscutae TaxID=1209917 RepID=A0AAI9XLT5_9PEZI|nr:hypothetical protein CCUS01_10704 [Colletotrichum cuscutae]